MKIKEIKALSAAVDALPEEYNNEHTNLMVFNDDMPHVMVANRALRPIEFDPKYGVWHRIELK